MTLKSVKLLKIGIIGGIISAILASVCCVGPFVLVVMGITGAWIGNLRTFEPFRPVFILFALSFLGIGFYRIYKKPKKECLPGELCAIPPVKRMGKIIFWIAAIIVLLLLISPYLIALWA